MADLLHQILIKAPPERIHGGLTTAEGLRSWWTGDTVAEPTVGSVAEFGFSNRATLFRMKITELSPNERVVWHCIGDVPEWKGTELTWELEQTGEGTVLRFRHAKWKSTGGMFALCNSTWGALMYRLRDWAEGGQPGPLFKGHL